MPANQLRTHYKRLNECESNADLRLLGKPERTLDTEKLYGGGGFHFFLLHRPD